MKVYERICLRDWAIEDTQGNRQECKRGKTYTTSGPRADKTVMVFSTYWVPAPDSIFEPWSYHIPGIIEESNK